MKSSPVLIATWHALPIFKLTRRESVVTLRIELMTISNKTIIIMPMYKLSGPESVITLHLEHPIHLHNGAEYRVALCGFYSENNISNLSTDGYIHFEIVPKSESTPGTVRTLTLERGYWTLETLQEQCRRFIKSLNTNLDQNKFFITKAPGEATVSIYSPIGFALDETMMKLLGFEKPCPFYCKAGKSVTATRPPNIRATDVVEIQCNLVENSYSSHDEHSHKHREHRILYTFFPAVPRGFKISETPRERYYAPLDRGLKKIQQITVALVDQDNRPLHNPFVNNILYLHLTSV